MSFFVLFSTDRHVTGKLLSALQKFGSTLNDYMHLFLPPIVRLFDSPEVPMGIRRGALECIDHLSDVLDFSEYASLIIHPLVRCLDSGLTELRPNAMDTLTSLVVSSLSFAENLKHLRLKEDASRDV